jgi:phosphoribosylformimino-5-aminoimidazole carboxamide ribotide isomerase
MIIIPAIDLKDGKCVRLLQGREEDVTVYSDDPAAMAQHWVELGARLLHIVDLDGAFTGEQKNLEKIREIRKTIHIPLELGGGIRTVEKIGELINLGIDRAILGTSAAKDPDMVREACSRHPGKVLVGIDARDGKVAVRGWVETTELDAIDFARQMEDAGAAGIIYTDISRDGMLTGPNVEAMGRMVKSVDIPVIASGGVSKLDDVRALMEIEDLWGVITGKALYSGSMDLEQAIKLAMGGV